jgi:hypothetical protein
MAAANDTDFFSAPGSNMNPNRQRRQRLSWDFSVRGCLAYLSAVAVAVMATGHCAAHGAQTSGLGALDKIVPLRESKAPAALETLAAWPAGSSAAVSRKTLGPSARGSRRSSFQRRTPWEWA